MTFSIVARDRVTGDLGIAVQSKFLAAGSLTSHARADVGAVATQALLDASYGYRGIELMAAGLGASAALEELLAADRLRDRRQAAFVDRQGDVAVHTGSDCMPWAGASTGNGFSCQGNVLVSGATIAAMAGAYDESVPLPERLVACLAAGQEAGGDARGQQSAGLLVVRLDGGYGGSSDRMIDLRVDDHDTPIDELRRLLNLHRHYFQRPVESELLPVSGPLADEIAMRLSALRNEEVTSADPHALWATLERWAGWENLEERMIRPAYIDPVVLETLRERTSRSKD